MRLLLAGLVLSLANFGCTTFDGLSPGPAAGRDTPVSGATTGSTCAEGGECQSGVCRSTCQEPTSSDGRKNRDESDIDCGGAAAPKCTEGKRCSGGTDCETGVCGEGVCSSSPSDGVRNGDESDVDCGGKASPKCEPGKACKQGESCTSGICEADQCTTPSPTDKVKNGDESDVDCGGTTTAAAPCEAGRSCVKDADCLSEGCDYKGKCAARRSCTPQRGGDTCGVGETGEAGARHESCCTEISFTSAGGQRVTLDKYDITAGRMRAFVERTSGNLRAAMTGKAGFPQQWLSYLPQDVEEANTRMGPSAVFEEQLGSSRVDGCYIKGLGTRTWWAAQPDDPSPMSKDQLDEKALNCVNLPMLYALCAWDGMRLPREDEYRAAWVGTDGRNFPWGRTNDVSRMVHKFNYFFPNVNGVGTPCTTTGACDNSVFIAAPGRRPTGYGPYGHADLAGLLFNMVTNGTTLGRWVWTGSFENHEPRAQAGGENLPARPRYWAAGGRCAR